MEKDLILFQDYSIAMFELTQLGAVLTSLVTVSDTTFTRVSITIDNVTHHEDNEDLMLAAIQLRNQII